MATVLVMAVVVAPAGGASPAERFDRLGISFEYPSDWFVTTEPLSNGSDPDYRFAASTSRLRRTRRDIGPCLPGIAGQLPRAGALVFLREYTGASRARALPRLDPLPRRLQLRRDSVPCGFIQGRGAWINFRQAARALLIVVYVGPTATTATERTLRRLVDSLSIRRR